MYMALMESEECMERIACEVGGLVSDAGIQQEHDQDGWPVCAQEVHQDDEDLQPRQGLQEEQQVRSLLRWPLSVTIIQKHCNDNLRQRNLIAAKTSKSLFKNCQARTNKNDRQYNSVLWVSMVCEIHIYL